MMMVFFSSTSTPLYSETWMPTSAGAYAGTCIFLVVLSAIFRALIAIRMNLAQLMSDLSRKRDIAILHNDSIAKGSPKGPWRVNEALTRACIDTVIAGVSYLL